MRSLKSISAAILIFFGSSLGSSAQAEDYDVSYRVLIRPDAGIADISISVKQSKGLLEELSASFEGDHWFDFKGDGDVELDGTSGFTWLPPAKGGRLTYSCRIDRLRSDQEYDSRAMPSWVLTRAEDFFPPMSARFKAGSQAKATLEFEFPPRWTVVTPYERKGKRFIIEQFHRKLDQPKGWILAGKLDQIEETIAGTRVAIAAPAKHDARLRDVLTLLRFAMPTLADMAEDMPVRIVIVMAEDPMWRGGLAGPNSLYLHTDRPLIDSDGTSPLIHELIHVITHARSAPGYDWLVEGLAEYYSLEVLRRSGAVSENTHKQSLNRLRERGQSVSRFEGEATAAETARAVTIMHKVDRLIRQETDDMASLDQVLAALVAERTLLDETTFLELIERTSGAKSAAEKLLKDSPEVTLPEE